MKRLLYWIFLCGITLMSSSSCAQERSVFFDASRVLMDILWDAPEEPVVRGIIEFYKPEMDRLMQQVVGYTEYEMRAGRPESLLSNFAVDQMYEYGKEHSDKEVDFALTNFGGLRASLPKGEVRRYDIYSVFPFENYLVYADVPGTAVRELFESFAENRVEAFSYNVKMEITDGMLKDVLIDGVQIDPYKTYRIVTIDFLLGGGDNVKALKKSQNVDQAGILLRDAILFRVDKINSSGKPISSSITNRVIIE
jgi:2',3'-cyclic-nucleotide 2'-phosphodiesterase (5'-nucleotidase family)